MKTAPEVGLNLDYVEAESSPAESGMGSSGKEGTDLNFLADVLQDYVRHGWP